MSVSVRLFDIDSSIGQKWGYVSLCQLRDILCWGSVLSRVRIRDSSYFTCTCSCCCRNFRTVTTWNDYMCTVHMGAVTASKSRIDQLIKTSTSLTALERSVTEMEEFSDKASGQLQMALEKCVRRVQEENFQAEIDAIHNDSSIPRTSNVLKGADWSRRNSPDATTSSPLYESSDQGRTWEMFPFSNWINPVWGTIKVLDYTRRQGGAQGSEKVHGIRRRLSKPVWPHSP